MSNKRMNSLLARPCILRVLAVALTWWLPLLGWAGVEDVGQLLRQFSVEAGQGRRVALANRLMEACNRAEILEEKVVFSATVPLDSMRQQVWYWGAEYFYDSEQYAQAVEYAQKALQLCHAGVAADDEADCLNLLAISHVRLGSYLQAAKYARQCYQLDVQSGDPDRISSSLNTLAGIYLSARQPGEAEKYVLRGLQMVRQTGNRQRLGVLQGMASEVYHSLGDDFKSLEYAQQAYQTEMELGRMDKVAVRLSQMAAAYIGLHRLQAAEDTLAVAIPMLRRVGNSQSLGISCVKMGQLLLDRKDSTGRAATYLQEAIDIFTLSGDLRNEGQARLLLYRALKDSEPAKAMVQLERYNALKDSLYDQQTGEQLSRYSAQLDNEMLHAESRQAHRDRLVIIVLCLSIIALLVVLSVGGYVWMYRRIRSQQEQNTQLHRDMARLQGDYAMLSSQYSNMVDTIRTDEVQPLVNEQGQELLQRVVAIAEEQMAQCRVNVDDMASQLCMTPSQFRRRLSALTGEMPQGYILRLRMQKARRLLEQQPELNVSEVALRCGYEDKSNFTRAFKRFFGLTPSGIRG